MLFRGNGWGYVVGVSRLILQRQKRVKAEKDNSKTYDKPHENTLVHLV